MRFTRVLARSARTEWRTQPMAHPYKPGKSFGVLPSGWPAYALFAGYAFVTLGEIAHRNHVIMEGGVARSPLASRTRDPDIEMVNFEGAMHRFRIGRLSYPKIPQWYLSIKMWFYQPGLVVDHACVAVYRFIWESCIGRLREYKLL
ncbi:unnamed protein product [Oikopleura dioica]|uniref:Uncharacterized protein n=1 Tax=Oikopleura dioica TaxID=34765 RepID=E4XE70_OIKDI|nr:unnamed protein product [Oikopleura dioica]